MTVICVDDHPVMLYGLKTSAQRAFPDSEIYDFTKVGEALACAQEHGCDVLLCEIEMYSQSGTLLAEEIKKINPKVNIIFVTVCGEREHAREVLKLKPSGYLTKPATQEQIMQELRELRYPIRYNNVGEDNRILYQGL